MNAYHVSLYSKGDSLPDMPSGNFFHSPELFHIIGNSPGQNPYMAVATDVEGNIVAHMLAQTRRCKALLPPFIYMQGRIYGEGEYHTNTDRNEIFGLMLHAMTRKLRNNLCFFIEFSDISRKMFGYRYFRKEGYFPINWQEVRNSLHSMSPGKRLSEKTRNRIAKIYGMGVETHEAKTCDEVHSFYRMLNSFHRLNIRCTPPPEKQVRILHGSKNCRIFTTTYKGKLIGGCLCVFSEGNAYLWHLASKRKSHPLLRPDIMTVWEAIQWSWKHNYAHFSFLDVGLPLHKNSFRDFTLSFGGKPMTKYRWFRFSAAWLNRLLKFIYRE